MINGAADKKQNAMYNVNPERLSHAYIISGKSEGLALFLASSAVCSAADSEKPCKKCRHCDKSQRGIHPDIMTISLLPDKKEITVDQIRALKEDSLVMPNETEKKVYIINEADAMNTAAQNALLTLLEEPPKHVMFILSADNRTSLLKTVRSRCVAIKDNSQTNEDSVGGQALADEFLKNLENNAEEQIRFSFALDKLDRIELSEFIGCALTAVAKETRIAVTAGDSGRIEKLLRAESALQKAADYSALNVSTVHIAGLLCAELL